MRACGGHRRGQRGGELKPVLAFLTLTFGNFGNQEDGLEADGHGLQFSPASAFANDLRAATVWADK